MMWDSDVSLTVTGSLKILAINHKMHFKERGPQKKRITTKILQTADQQTAQQPHAAWATHNNTGEATKYLDLCV